MKIYRKATLDIQTGDRVESKFNGQWYPGNVSEVYEDDGFAYINFAIRDSLDQELEELYEDLNDPNYAGYSKSNVRKTIKLTEAVMEWMDGEIPLKEIKLIFAGDRWKNVQNENGLDVIKSETFYYGVRSWDVREAKRILHKTPRSTIQYPTIKAKSSLESGEIATFNEYLEKADVNFPVILITTEHGQFPIDGWHRLQKAIDQGVETVPAYILNQSESKQVETT
jgi:hypothetical protein